MRQVGASVHAVDLEVDVLVRSDGRTYEVVDEDDFEHACAQGWMSDREAEGARVGLRELRHLLESETFVEFLNDVFPFGPSAAPPAVPMKELPLEHVPFLAPGRRSSW